MLKIEKERYTHLWYATRFFFWTMLVLWEIEIFRVYHVVYQFKAIPTSFYFYLDRLDIDIKLIIFTVAAFFFSVLHLLMFKEKKFVQKILAISSFFLLSIVAKFGGFLMLLPFTLIFFSMIYWIKKKREMRVIIV